jgi:hypothetical protein
MKLTFAPIIFSLVAQIRLSTAQANSDIFSQYIGATATSVIFVGTGASYQSDGFTMCTNYAHGLNNPSHFSGVATSYIPQLEQEQADGVCQFCTSLSLSRVDSCCAVASSVDCFGQFAPAKTPAANLATATANNPTTTGVAGIPTVTTSGSSCDKAHIVSK